MSGTNRWQLRVACGLKLPCQVSQYRVGEEITVRDVIVQALAEIGDDPNSQQGVATEGEGVVMESDLITLEEFCPDRRQDGLGLALGRLIGSRGVGIAAGNRQSSAVQLAIRSKRQGVQTYIGGWHHVLG